MTEKLMTPGNMDELIQKVWNDSQAKIKENIEYTIRSELTLRAQTLTRKRMDALLTPLIEKAIEEKKELIVEALNQRAIQVIEKAIDRFDNSFKYTLQQNLTASVQDPLRKIGNDLSNLMFGIIDEIIRDRLKEKEKEYAEKQHQKRLAAEKAAKEQEGKT